MSFSVFRRTLADVLLKLNVEIVHAAVSYFFGNNVDLGVVCKKQFFGMLNAV